MCNKRSDLEEVLCHGMRRQQTHQHIVLIVPRKFAEVEMEGLGPMG